MKKPSPLHNLTPEEVQQIKAQRLAETIEPLHEKQKSYIAATVPETQKLTFSTAYGGNSKAKAIQAKCLQCANFDRREITACTVLTCPLHSVRPYQQSTEDGEADE